MMALKWPAVTGLYLEYRAFKGFISFSGKKIVNTILVQ